MIDVSQIIEWIVVDVVDGRAVETGEVIRWKVEPSAAGKPTLNGA